MRLLLLLMLYSFNIVFSEDIAALCGRAEAQLSCGQCIKQHPDCAWCRDPHALSSVRCQPKSNFTREQCNPDYVYSPVTEMKIAPHNLPIDAMQRDGRTVVQLEPQQVVLRMKPGDQLTVPFKYSHRAPANGAAVRDLFLQTSEFHQAKGVELKFLINCNGQEIEAKQCPGIQEGQLYDFKIQVTLLRCSNEGDVSISVGVYGYNTVSALYVTPLCGCECEKLQQQEKNSPLCHGHGSLICGQCVCESSRGGDRCDCPLATYGARNAMELEDRCRESSSSLICGGKGSCHCGQCQCHAPTISGKFCQCDHTSCPVGGPLNTSCSSNGVCDCGKCKCEDGWERDDCSCSTNKATCMESGLECSSHGHCECGRCVCDEGYTGAFCGSDDEMTVPELNADGVEPSKDHESTTSSSEEDTEDDGSEAQAEGQTASASLTFTHSIALLAVTRYLF